MTTRYCPQDGSPMICFGPAEGPGGSGGIMLFVCPFGHMIQLESATGGLVMTWRVDALYEHSGRIHAPKKNPPIVVPFEEDKKRTSDNAD